MSARYLAPPLMVVGVGLGVVAGLMWRPAWLVPSGMPPASSSAVRSSAGRGRRHQGARARRPGDDALVVGVGFLSSPRGLVR